MPETISPGKDEQEAFESQGAMTAGGLEHSPHGLSAEMSTNKEDLLNEKGQLEQELEFARDAGDSATVESVIYRLDSIEAQLDAISRQEEHKNE